MKYPPTIRWLTTTFQSRFGSAEWLPPYIDETVKVLAAWGEAHRGGDTRLSTDCLETIDEIDREHAQYFCHASGERLARINCLNNSDS